MPEVFPDEVKPNGQAAQNASPSGKGILPLPRVDIAADPIPPRDWAVRDRIPARNVSLLSGEGAIGKSILLLQLAASTVLSRDWLGTVPEPGPVMTSSSMLAQSDTITGPEPRGRQ